MSSKTSIEPRFFTRAQAAEIIGICLRTLDHLVTRRQIGYLRLPSAKGQGSLRFTEKHLADFVASREVKPVDYRKVCG